MVYFRQKENSSSSCTGRTPGTGLRALVLCQVVGSVISPLPAFANGAATSVLNPLEAISLVSQLSGLILFTLFVVYLGAACVLLARMKFRQGLIDVSLACLSLVLMVIEPPLLNMLLYSGLQYPVKLSLQFALASICALVALGLLVLPSILAFSTEYKGKVNVVLMNLSGCLIFPLFIFALYLVQSKMVGDAEPADAVPEQEAGAKPDKEEEVAPERETGSKPEQESEAGELDETLVPERAEESQSLEPAEDSGADGSQDSDAAKDTEPEETDKQK